MFSTGKWVSPPKSEKEDANKIAKIHAEENVYLNKEMLVEAPVFYKSAFHCETFGNGTQTHVV
jgi:hypothetical protein